MAIYDSLPKDPVMLLSFVNTQLRDHYSSFDAFVAAYQTDGDEIINTLKSIDYKYDETINQFV